MFASAKLDESMLEGFFCLDTSDQIYLVIWFAGVFIVLTPKEHFGILLSVKFSKVATKIQNLS